MPASELGKAWNHLGTTCIIKYQQECQEMNDLKLLPTNILYYLGSQENT